MILHTTADGWTGAAGSMQWRVTEQGIETRKFGHSMGVRRSKVLKELPGTLWANHKGDFGSVSEAFLLDPVVLLTTAVVESGGKTAAVKYEKHLNDYSIGLCQTLTATASAMCRMLHWPRLGEVDDVELLQDVIGFLCPDKSVPKGGGLKEWEQFLGIPYNSLCMAASLHAYNSERYATNDPIGLYAAYNAGSIRRGNNAWGLASATMALDSFANFYSLSLEVVNAH